MHGMRKVLWFTLLLVIAQPSHAGIVITDVNFFNVLTINGRRQPDRPISGAISRNRLGRLYARFVIIGTKATIDQLARSGYLTVRAEWSLDNKIIDVVEVGISQERWDLSESEFRRQVQEDGFFKFRTTTYRSYIPAGRYKLTIRDVQGNILSPEGFSGTGLYQPTIEVTNP
jgi:hypothetical protein